MALSWSQDPCPGSLGCITTRCQLSLRVWGTLRTVGDLTLVYLLMSLKKWALFLHLRTCFIFFFGLDCFDTNFSLYLRLAWNLEWQPSNWDLSASASEVLRLQARTTMHSQFLISHEQPVVFACSLLLPILLGLGQTARADNLFCKWLTEYTGLGSWRVTGNGRGLKETLRAFF